MSRKGRSESPPISLTHFTQSEYRELQKDVEKIKTKKFEIAKNMPPKKHKTTEPFNVQHSEVVDWLVNQNDIRQYVFNKAKSLGVIKYDDKSKMWKGVKE